MESYSRLGAVAALYCWPNYVHPAESSTELPVAYSATARLLGVPSKPARHSVSGNVCFESFVRHMGLEAVSRTGDRILLRQYLDLPMGARFGGAPCVCITVGSLWNTYRAPLVPLLPRHSGSLEREE